MTKPQNATIQALHLVNMHCTGPYLMEGAHYGIVDRQQVDVSASTPGLCHFLIESFDANDQSLGMAIFDFENAAKLTFYDKRDQVPE